MKSDAMRDFYNVLLHGAILKMDRLKCIVGSEGAAYFDGELVLKNLYEGHRVHSERDSYLFDGYCNEIKSFYEQNYPVPQIYAWYEREQTKLMRDKNHSESQSSSVHDYFILEERVRGRSLFEGLIHERYDSLGEGRCSKGEFNRISYFVNEGLSVSERALAKDIVMDFIKSFADVNEMMESVSPREMENFVLGAYNMYMKGRFSSPDMYPSNIFLTDGGKFKIIDNKRNTGADITEALLSDKDNRQILAISNIFDIFCMSYLAEETPLDAVSTGVLDISFYSEIEPILKRNERLVKEVITKLTQTLKKCFSEELLGDIRMLEILSKKFDDGFNREQSRAMMEVYGKNL